MIRRLLLVRLYQDAPNASLAHPLGIMHLASYIRAKRPEIEVKLVDMRLTRMQPRDLVPILEEFQPDWVGLSSLSFEGATLPPVCKVIKRWNPAARVVVGGPHASADPERITEDPNADVCVLGEG
ncbi:MAG: cobalamin-dependent protein, partial [Myxococcales bacterium]|nr:cobalamin-dependent protein [Myxococcales bacterium]